MRVVQEADTTETIEPTDLIKIDEIDPTELFTAKDDAGALLVAGLIARIEDAVKKHVPDVSTDAGRKAIASLARKVSSAKVLVDNLGKDRVAELKAMPARIDAGRKVWRDSMDALRDETRQPLTEWEAEQERLAEAARLAAQIIEAEEEAYAEESLRERERVVQEREAEIAKAEAEQKAKAEAERLEREERIAREAAERAKREAEEAAERKERERLAAEEAERKRLERLAANARHRERIHREARESFVALDFTEGQAAYLVEKIAAGVVNNVSINY